MTRRAISISAVALPAASRRWMWTTLAPLAHTALASAAISSGVTGRDVLSALLALGPVRAAVTTTGRVSVAGTFAAISVPPSFVTPVVIARSRCRYATIYDSV